MPYIFKQKCQSSAGLPKRISSGNKNRQGFVERLKEERQAGAEVIEHERRAGRHTL